MRVACSATRISWFGSGCTKARDARPPPLLPCPRPPSTPACRPHRHTQGTAQASPKLKACQPARAGYAQDLRDPALAAAGAIAKLVRQPVTFTMQGQPYGCLVNGQASQRAGGRHMLNVQGCLKLPPQGWSESFAAGGTLPAALPTS